MEVLKVPEFGSRFSFPENQNFEFENGIAQMTSKICVQMAEQYDEAVIAEIANAARACGVSDCVVLNKKAIMDALMKQVPQQPDLEGDGYSDGELVYDTGYCPRCHQDYEIEYHTPKYCENCGQAIDWGTDNA